MGNKPGIASFIVALIIIGLMGYGGWKLKRWWNYSYEYGPQIQKELEPMRQEIKELKIRIEKLESK
jgi:hypothetical protein